MANNEIRNPSKAYFKWKMPVIIKSEDDWNFWNTEDKYNRTMFIGYNDTTTPHVASLFIIVDGKPMQAVGDDVIARIAGLETNTAQALADIQALIDRVNAQQTEISNLQQECQRILEDAESAVRAAQIWAEGTDAQVAERGGEHSAKGWAQKANDIVASGLPSDATFDHITVTSISKFGQDPDRGNQPGLEIEGTGEIQAYRTVNMMNGATVSYDETVEMPWSDSSNKVPNTAWVQQAVQHGVIDPNTELTVKKISTTGGGAWLYGERIDDSGGKSLAYLNVHKPASETDSAYITLNVNSDNLGYGANFEVGEGTITMRSRRFIYFDNGDKTANAEAIRIGQASSQAYATNRYLYSELVGRLVNGLQIGLVGDNEQDGVPFKVLRSDNTTIGKWMAAFGVTPTVPDITDAADASDKVPNTKWVQAAIAAGGGGSGAVTSVNGKTGEVVLAAADVGAAPADALASYVTTDALNTELAGKQDKLTAESDLAVNNLTAASVSSSGTIKAANADGSKYAQVANTGLVYSSTGANNLMHDITQYGLRLRELTSGGGHKATLIAGLSGSNACLQSNDGFAFQRSSMAALDPRPIYTYLTMGGDEIHLFASTNCHASMPAATDSSTTVPTTSWVQSAIDNKTSTLQPKLTAGDGITISESNVISVTGGTGGAVSSVNGKTGEVVLNATDVGAITGAEADTKITTALEPYAKTADVTATLEPYAKSADVTADITAAVAPLATTESLNTGLAGKQDKLTAGSGIAISDTNVISATVSSPVDSVNGNTGAVVLTGDNIMTASDSTTSLNSALAGKQASITADTELSCKSVTTSYDSALNSINYAGNISFTGDSGNGSLGKITANELFTNASGYYGTRIQASGIKCTSGAGGTTWFNVNSSDNTVSVDGTITATSPAADANNNQLATTAWVKTAIASSGGGGGAVTSVNGNTGAVVLTADNVMLNDSSTTSINTALAGKQDSLTESSDLTVGSLTAGSADSGLYAGRYSIRFTYNSNDKLFVDATGPSVSNLTGGDLGPATGEFNWYINTTTDYNKFNVFNRYHVTNEETHEVITNDTSVLSIGGSPTDHSTWIDFTATYMSFKGNTNFGETGMNHAMNFNGPSTFNNTADFLNNTHISGNVTFWKVDAEGSSTPWASFDKSTGKFDIDYLTSTDGGNGENRVTIMADSREANYGATFNLPVTVSDASFKRTSTLAADDNSEEVPTTAWVKAAIASSGSSVPDNITCKTLKVTNWDGELDSIEFAGNLKYSGDYGNGSLGIITAREFYANSSGYYSTRVKTSGISLTSGASADKWFNADSSTRTLTINGTLKSSTPSADANNTDVATTAWVNTAITAKAATKPTLTYAEKSGEPTVTKIEQCNGGSLCTIMWTGQVSTATGHVYIDLPTEFASAKIVSTQFTAHDTGTAAPWTADASISGGKIMLSVKSTAASSSASATIVLYKA